MAKTYSTVFKARVALDLLREEKTLAQISAEYGVAFKTLRAWRAQALQGLPRIFDAQDDRAGRAVADAQRLEELYAEIGRLATQVSALKKKLSSAGNQ